MHLFDSFAGFPDLSAHDPAQRRSEFADVTVTKVRNCFASFDNVHIHPGFFGHLGGVADRRFAFVYYDAVCTSPRWSAAGSFTAGFRRAA